MARGCTPGLSHRWSFYCWPETGYDGPLEEAPRNVPEEGDIGIRDSTGSCYLVQSIKPSTRKARGWYVVHVEGLGVDAAQLGEEGTFSLGYLSHEDHEAIRMIEQAERLERGEIAVSDG